MPAVRYTVPGRLGGRGVTAFTPAPPRTTGVFSLKNANGVEIEGQPGTQAIPAPRQYWTDAAAGRGHLPSGGYSNSVYMPASWFPSLYYGVQRLWRGIGGVQIFSDNLMPIPARDPRNVLPAAGGMGTLAQGGTMLRTPGTSRRGGGLGQLQVTWPKREPVWGHRGAR